MCIRDSLYQHHVEELMSRDPVTVGSEESVDEVIALLIEHRIGAVPVIDGAVSYTHLRAHETVLDLVCRLLLEKKKIYRHTDL